jgi:hypothetical protein
MRLFKLVQGIDMAKIIPCKEQTPNLPVKKSPPKPKESYSKEELFAFDTETTMCGKKELRSYQSALYSNDQLFITVYALKGWYEEGWSRTLSDRLSSILRKDVNVTCKSFSSVEDLRRACIQFHENTMYGGEPRLIKNKSGNWRRSRRKVKRCAVAFNGNFDYGVLSDQTKFDAEMKIGVMEGAGVSYRMISGDRTEDSCKYGLRINALYLGADSVPFTEERGQLWELSSPSKQVWGCYTLRQVGEHIGISKLEADFNDSAYAAMDAVITLEAAIKLTDDLERMGFTGAPDRFISGATVSKDLLKQHYTPFYLTEEQHTDIWPAYFGGMTGATRPEVVRDSVENVVYGDLDGAYNVSGQKLRVFTWDGVKQLSCKDVNDILQHVKEQPRLFWYYGSVHIKVTGDFGRCPVRVSVVGDNNELGPSTAQGLVWAEMTNYSTTLTLGDYLMSQPRNVTIHGGWMATRDGDSQCLFKMTADERAKYPKSKDPIANGWWKLAGNCLYGCFANRNGKERMQPGPFFNALIASSITGAIRYSIHTINEAVGTDSYYNDTDSALLSETSFNKAKESLKDLGIGFSNKTDDELPNCDVARLAIVHGSKRYCMVAPDGTFGAKVHGLGMWFTFHNGKVKSLARDHELIEAVWRCCYPDELGEADEKLRKLKVFHKFGIKTQRMSRLVESYMLRQGIPFSETWKYAKAGNFGFTSPTFSKGNVKPVACFDAHEANMISDMSLEMVAYGWSESRDKKFNYDTGSRWAWEGSEVRTVLSISHTQMLQAEEALLSGDISMNYMEE